MKHCLVVISQKLGGINAPTTFSITSITADITIPISKAATTTSKQLKPQSTEETETEVWEVYFI